MNKHLFFALSLATAVQLSSHAQTNTFPATGNVGIGTTSPQQRLHVEGTSNQAIFVSTSALGTGSGSGMIGSAKALPTASGQRLGYFLTGSRGGAQNGYNQAGMVGYAGGAWTASSHPAYLAFETTPAGSITRTERVRIAANGFVGVGTSDPGYVLDVAGRMRLRSEGGSNTAGLWLNNVNNSGVTGFMGVLNDTSMGFFGNASGWSMIMNTNRGNVGIGTATPVQRLHVAGNGIFTGNVGIGTATPAYPLEVSSSTAFDVIHAVNTFSGGSARTGVYGQSNNSPLGIGVYGDGGQFGVAGSSPNIGVHGESFSGHGVEGWSYNGTAVYGSTEFGGYAGYFNGAVYATTYQTSDGKLKQNINELSSAMAIINALHPKVYEYRRDGSYRYMNLPEGKHYGLLAQDLEQVLPTLVKESKFDAGREKQTRENVTTGGPVARNTNTANEAIAFKAVNYTELISVLIKAVQEQDEESKARDKKIALLEQRLQNLEALMTKNNRNTSISVSSAFLETAAPNPTRSTTTIRCQLPANSSGTMVLADAKGRTVKTLNLSKGSSQVTVNSLGLAGGVYNYTLWVDGQQADSKQLVVAR